MSALLDCREYIRAALNAETSKRVLIADNSWIERERMAVAVAANEWAAAHGIARRVTVDDVERVEGRAVGHYDYVPKLALYVAELLCEAGL